MISKFDDFKIWQFQNLMISKLDDFKLWWFQNLIISNQENFVALPPSISSYSVDSFIFFAFDDHLWCWLSPSVSATRTDEKSKILTWNLDSGAQKQPTLQNWYQNWKWKFFLCKGLMRYAVRGGFPCKFWKKKDARFILRPLFSSISSVSTHPRATEWNWSDNGNDGNDNEDDDSRDWLKEEKKFIKIFFEFFFSNLGRSVRLLVDELEKGQKNFFFENFFLKIFVGRRRQRRQWRRQRWQQWQRRRRR